MRLYMLYLIFLKALLFLLAFVKWFFFCVYLQTGDLGLDIGAQGEPLGYRPDGKLTDTSRALSILV